MMVMSGNSPWDQASCSNKGLNSSKQQVTGVFLASV